MQKATVDLFAGAKRIDLAATLAFEDLVDRYRRSYVGLAWIILSFLAFILVKSLIFGGLFATDDYDFFSHLVIGFAIYGFISSAISGGASIFISNRTWILSTNLPYSVYIHVLAIRSLVELGLVGLAAAILVFTMGDISPGHLWSVPFAIIPFYISTIGICLAIGPLSTRHRDVVYAIQTLMRILFFATPIIWLPTPGTMRGTIATWNPLTYYIDIVRVPIIEGQLPLISWSIVGALTALLLVCGMIVFSRTKQAIPLWL